MKPCSYCKTALPPDNEGNCRACGGRLPGINIAIDVAQTIPKDARWQQEILYVGSGDIEITGDSAAYGGPLRVRQRVMRADSWNLNNRLYPRSVIDAALDEARQRARAGTMLSEYEHPKVVEVDGEEQFVPVPGNETARVDDVGHIDTDGWLWIDRTILDTSKGRLVADGIRKKKFYGISTRFKLKTDSVKKPDGKTGRIATWMRLHTWDDVRNPAVTGAGYAELLTDSELASLTRLGGFSMHPKFTRAYNSWIKGVTRRLPGADIAKLRLAVCDAMDEAEKEKPDDEDKDMTPYAEKIAEGDTLVQMAGYNGDRPAPTGIQPSEGAEPAQGFARPLGTEQGQAGVAPGITGQQGLEGDAMKKFVQKQMDDKAAADAEAAIDSAITVATTDNNAFSAFTDSQRNYLLSNVKGKSQKPEAVADCLKAEIDALSKVVAEDRKSAAGLVQGNTVVSADTSGQHNSRPATTEPRLPKWFEGVEKLLAATDAYRKRVGHTEDICPNTRKLNRTLIEPIIQDWAKKQGDASGKKYADVDSYFAGEDAYTKEGESALGDSVAATFKSMAAMDSTTSSNVFTQPTVIATVLYQTYQDLKFLQFVDAIGPGLAPENGQGPGWFGVNPQDGRVGRALRFPTATYTPPTGYGNSGLVWDEGLLTPEGSPIDEGGMNLVWLTFGAAKRSIAMSLTKEAAKFIGNGPLNWDLVAQNLWGISYDKARRTDRGLAFEMCMASDVYGSVHVAAQAQNLANNTVFTGAGSVTVNLNPTVTAASALATSGGVITDPFVIYGANVIGACRVRCGQSGAASPYYGNLAGSVPIVMPYTSLQIAGDGTPTVSTLYAVTLSAPAAMVEGYLDTGSQIQDKQGAPGATFAVDHINGCIVFKSGVTNNAGVITEAITIAYDYVTNYDNITLKNFQLLGLSVTGETPDKYYNRLLLQIDSTAALMGDQPRFMAPNLAIVPLQLSKYITGAQMFYQEASPKDTTLYPSDEHFGSRNQVDYARINAPTPLLNQDILLTRRGSTRYAIDTPFELEGPYQKYHSSGKVIDAKVFYGSEIFTQGTPVPTQTDGTTLNPPARKIRIR